MYERLTETEQAVWECYLRFVRMTGAGGVEGRLVAAELARCSMVLEACKTDDRLATAEVLLSGVLYNGLGMAPEIEAFLNRETT